MVYDHGYDANGNRTSSGLPERRADELRLRRAQPADASCGRRRASARWCQGYAYTLGAAGNRTRIEEADGTVRSYGYDAALPPDRRDGRTQRRRRGLRRRPSATTRSATGCSRCTPTRRARSRTINATFDARDRQLTRGAQSWTWDANGNLTAKVDEATYAWDFDDRLQQVTLDDGTVVTHTYDADGVRVRTETQAAGRHDHRRRLPRRHLGAAEPGGGGDDAGRRRRRLCGATTCAATTCWR